MTVEDNDLLTALSLLSPYIPTELHEIIIDLYQKSIEDASNESSDNRETMLKGFNAIVDTLAYHYSQVLGISALVDSIAKDMDVAPIKAVQTVDQVNSNVELTKNILTNISNLKTAIPTIVEDIVGPSNIRD